MIKIFQTQRKICFAYFLLEVINLIALALITTSDIPAYLQYLLGLVLVIFLTNITITIMTLLQNSLASKAWEEKNDTVLNNDEQVIFSEEIIQDNLHQVNYKRFKRFFVPFSVVVLCLFQFFASLMIYDYFLASKIVLNESIPFLFMTSFCLLLAICFFLLSRYCSGLAYQKKHLLLRPITSNSFASCLILLLLAITLFSTYIGKEQFSIVFIIFGYILVGFNLIIALERGLLLILDLYRPKVDNNLPIYESRLLSLFCHSKGILYSFNSIIHYQFGVQVNEKTLNLLLKRYLPYAVLTQLGLAFCLSSIVYIQEDKLAIEQNIITRQTKILDSGLYWRLPYPLVLIKRLPKEKTYHINITHINRREKQNKTPFIPWSANHSNTALQIAKNSEGNLILLSFLLQLAYKIDNPYDFISQNSSVEKTIQLLVKNQINHYLTKYNLDATTFDYQPLVQYLNKNLNHHLKPQKLGIKLQKIQMLSFSPPQKIAKYYNQIIQTKNEAKANYQNSLSNAFSTQIKAQDKAFSLINEEKSNTYTDKLLNKEERKFYNARQNAFNSNPKIYQTIITMNLLDQVAKNKDAQKIVILSNKDKIINLDLKNINTDFFISE